MLAITNILVPIVFSWNCAWAARYAARLAKEFGSQIVFLHVSQDPNGNTLEDFVSKEVGAGGHRSVVVGGDPADRIIDLAREYSADLIVMPTYHGRFRTFLIGSVTAKVLHDVECPVLTGIHHYDRPPQVPESFRTIVCAVADAPGCVPLFRWAHDFAARVGARVRVVHAMPAVDEVSENCGEIDIRRYLTTQARDNFSARFAAESDPPPVELHGGEVGTVIREAALVDQADLVVIGRGHADRALGRLRTHSYSIIRNAPCPVISV
ncbi:MAG TPA: universal stress protein [Bryobacteraceae bacterium]|nr:universal stress protein [Bryobacteraceae bacterium]